MAQKSLKKNFLFNLSYQILSYITPLITAPYLARTLGADGIGQISMANSIVSYYVIFATLGITIYGQREISYYQDDIDKRSQAFWNLKCLELITSVIAIFTYLLVGVFIGADIIYFVMIQFILGVLVDVSWLFQGIEEFGKIVGRNFVIKFINLAYIFIFIKDKQDLIFYAFSLGFFNLVANFSLWMYLPKYIKKVPVKQLRPFSDIKGILQMFAPTIAISIYTVLDKTMIGVITKDYFENGYYEQAIKIPTMLLAVISSFTIVAIPRIGRYFQEKNNIAIMELMYKSYRLVWFIGLPLVFGLFMVSDNFIPWFLGEGFEKTAYLMKILAFLIVAIGLSGVTGTQYLATTKRQNYVTLSVTVGAFVNFILNMLLIPRFASVGAAIASVTAEMMVTLVQFIIVRKEIAISEVFKQGKNYFISVAAMVVVLLFIVDLLPATVVGTAIIAFVGAGVYFICLFLLKDQLLLENVISIFKKVVKR